MATKFTTPNRARWGVALPVFLAVHFSLTNPRLISPNPTEFVRFENDRQLLGLAIVTLEPERDDAGEIEYPRPRTVTRAEGSRHRGIRDWFACQSGEKRAVVASRDVVFVRARRTCFPSGLAGHRPDAARADTGVMTGRSCPTPPHPVPGTPSKKWTPRARRNRHPGLAVRHAVLILVAVVFAFLLLFMVISSLKPRARPPSDTSSLRAFLPPGDIGLDNCRGACQRAGRDPSCSTR